MLANSPETKDRKFGSRLRKTYLAASVRLSEIPGDLRAGFARKESGTGAAALAYTSRRPLTSGALCIIVALSAFSVIALVHAGVADAQGVGEITGAIDKAKTDIVTIGLSVGVLMLAVGFIMMMWPGTNERVKGAGMKVIVAAGLGMAGLGLLAALSGMITGWSGGGDGGGGGN